MKSVLSIILILLFIESSYCQLKKEFAPDQTKWYQLYGGGVSISPGGGTLLYQHRIYMTNGYTIIDNKEFQKVYVSLGSYQCTWGRYGNSCFENYPSMGNGFQPEYYNEDNFKFLTYFYTNAGVIYWGQPESLTVLYDFNLKVNDHFDTHVVVKVDTVKIDNTERKRITFDNNDVWVEGIGNIKSGLKIESRPVVAGAYEKLENYRINNRVIVTGVKVSDNNKFQVYPNPANDLIWVNNPNFINRQTIIIRDINGIEVVKEYFTENPAILNIANQKPGIYFITIQDHKKKQYYKLVKN